MKSFLFPVVALLVFLLTGCTRFDAASLNSGNQTSIAVEVNRLLPWSKWNVSLVILNSTICQRRYNLASEGKEAPVIGVNKFTADIYVLHQSSHWYLADIKNCYMEEAKDKDISLLAGPAVGQFALVKGNYVFTEGTPPKPASP